MLTQPITLITGVPGAGKTLRAIYEGLELQKSGIDVYALGIDDLDPNFIQTVPETFKIEDWKTLPKGSCLIVDEAHKYLPVRQPGKPPQWIQDLTEIRHYGITMILVSQDPRNLDAFVRRLIGEHLHVTRKAGFKGAMVRTFPIVSENPNDFHAKENSSIVPWLYPKDLFKVYTSATQHLIKPKIPVKIIFAIIAALAILFIIPWSCSKYNKVLDNAGPKVGDKAGTTSQKSPFASASDPSASPSYSTIEEYNKLTTAIVPGIPWTAPIFHNLEVTANPEIFCMIFDDGGKDQNCSCVTEQGTTAKNVPQPVCEILARDGSYNPYKQNPREPE